jgi:hypothetical protein
LLATLIDATATLIGPLAVLMASENAAPLTGRGAV